MTITNNGQQVKRWQDAAACRPQLNPWAFDASFSSEAEQKNKMKNLCYSVCTVRANCVKYALEEGIIDGVWGGLDENELRRTLSVNAEGNEVRRGRYPQCPYCNARTSRLKTKTIDLPDGGRWTTAQAVECLECGFEWTKRSSANAVKAYHQERANKEARAAKAALIQAARGLEQAMQRRVNMAYALEQAEIAFELASENPPEKWWAEDKIEKWETNKSDKWEALKVARRTSRVADAAVVRLTDTVENLKDEHEQAAAWAKSGPTQLRRLETKKPAITER